MFVEGAVVQDSLSSSSVRASPPLPPPLPPLGFPFAEIVSSRKIVTMARRI